MKRQLFCFSKGFKVIIIHQITYRAFIWYILTRKKRNKKTLVTQLAQAQALRICQITIAFKAISMQALNVEAYLTPIGFELDKKAD